MKACGITFIVLGCLSLIGTIVAAANGRDGNIGGGIAFIALGAYLVHRARQKKEEQKRHDDWSNQ